MTKPEALLTGAFDPIIDAIAEAVRAKMKAPVGRSKRLLTTDQAAEYLSVDPETVKRLRAAGKLFSVGLLERKLLFDIDDLDSVISACKEKP